MACKADSYKSYTQGDALVMFDGVMSCEERWVRVVVGHGVYRWGAGLGEESPLCESGGSHVW